MKKLKLLSSHVREWFQPARLDAEMNEEMRAHVEMRTQQHIAAGMKPAEARYAALRQFGWFESVKDQCRDQRDRPFARHWSALAQDLHYGARTLRKSPGFTVVALLTLTLGIGANSAIFQLLNAVRLKSLPIPRPAELIEARVTGNPGLGIYDGANSEMTFPLWEQLREQHNLPARLFAWSSGELPYGDDVEPRMIRTLWTSGDYFPRLGISPARGRLFTAEDDQRGVKPNGLVISYAFWQREFGGQDSVIGKSVTVGDQIFPIVGVTPANFFGLEVGREFDVVLPLTSRAIWWGGILERRDAWWLRVMGRLNPGATLAQADDALKAAGPGIVEATTPIGYQAEGTAAYRRSKLGAVPAGAGVSRLRNDYGRPLYLLLGITGLVLLIACLNLANLMLARATARRRELAVRLAIGASRGRLIRQLLAENLLLAGAGAACGAALARAFSGAIVWFLNARGTEAKLDLDLDWRAFAFAGAVAILTCVLFGLAPALRSTRVTPASALGAGGRVAGHRETFAWQRGLAVVQVAVSLVLLAGSLLLVRSFWNLATLRTGFRQDGIFFAFADFGRLPAPRQEAMKKELLDKVRSIPQIEAAATTTYIPLSGSSWTMGVHVAGAGKPSDGWSKFAWVSPDFFRTMEISVLSGRDFTERDSATAPKVALVNETFVRRYLPGVNPIGATVQSIAEPNYPSATYEIIGVVNDTKYSDLRQEIPPLTFAPAPQHPLSGPWVAIAARSSAPLNGIINSVRQRAAEISPTLRLGTSVFRTRIREGLAREQLMAWLSGFFGLLAAALVTIGLYGLISYITLTRRNELGIRLALGATPRDILRLVLGQGLRLAAVGIPAGLLGALALTRFLRGLLFGITPMDPATLLSISAFLTVVASFAAWLPARRAARVDPMEALRAE